MNSSNSSTIGTLLSLEKIFRETNLHCATTIWFISEKFLDAGIQDVSTSISIEIRKMIKCIKFEEMSEDGDESDKHI